jgi:energy-coupling factor transport system ATP-binding protein
VDDPIVDVRDIWFRYADRPPALRGVNLRVAAGAWLAILGCNGSGKTTLVKHLNGLLRPWRGCVRIAGQDIAGRPIGQIAETVGYLPQHPDRLLFSATVEGETAFGLRQRGLAEGDVKARVESILARLDLLPLADLPPAIQGYGVRRKISLAAILALQPQIIVLDEPTNALDAGGARTFLDIVQDYRRAGATVIMVTHDLDLAARYASDIALLRDGELLAAGPMRAILSDAGLLKRAGLPALPICRLYDLWRAASGESWPLHPLTPEEFAEGWFAAGEAGRP